MNKKKKEEKTEKSVKSAWREENDITRVERKTNDLSISKLRFYLPSRLCLSPSATGNTSNSSWVVSLVAAVSPADDLRPCVRRGHAATSNRKQTASKHFDRAVFCLGLGRVIGPMGLPSALCSSGARHGREKQGK